MLGSSPPHTKCASGCLEMRHWEFTSAKRGRTSQPHPASLTYLDHPQSSGQAKPYIALSSRKEPIA
jgi:hypothetical protein